LLPDWTYSPLKGRVEKPSLLRQSRPKIELQIFRCRYETWNIFKQHHYLTEDLNKAAKCFVTIWNDKPIGFIAILPMPSGTVKNAYRVSRLVILPDFQGLGIGMNILNVMGSMYKKNDKKLYIKTSNPSLFKGMEKNLLNWKKVTEQNDVTKVKKRNANELKKGNNNGMKLYKESITKGYKYVGLEFKSNIDILTFNADAWKDVAQNQTRLF